jgi:hypothetical protein
MTTIERKDVVEVDRVSTGIESEKVEVRVFPGGARGWGGVTHMLINCK